MELIARLRAALDEDERVALGAAQRCGPEWTLDRHDTEDPYSDGISAPGGSIVSSGDVMVSEGEHMERHDPARVLRQVAAMRKILDEHEIEEPGTDYQYCRSCQDHERHDARSAPCATVLALAEALGIEP
jgi:hypothetical protein